MKLSRLLSPASWFAVPEPAVEPRAGRLPPGLARKVRRIEIATRRLINQGLAGEYHSVFKGRGVEFAEVRPYQPGDDVRSIDWNVTARMDAPYVKQFVEERDLTVFLAVDVSGSMTYGSRALLKRELAAEVAALLAFAAITNGDRVGAALLADGMALFVPPERRRAHVLRIVREILVRPGHGGTDLERGLGGVLSNLRRRSVLFVISDFLDTACPRALQRAALRHDLVVLEILDPHDDTLPRVHPPVLLRDAETGALGLASGARLGSQHFARRMAERQELARSLRRLGADHLVLRTNRPYLAPLVAFFEARRKRLNR